MHWSFFSSLSRCAVGHFSNPHTIIREWESSIRETKKTKHITEKLTIHQIAGCKLVNPASGTSLTGFGCERLRARPLQPSASPSKRDSGSYLLLFLHHCCCFVSVFVAFYSPVRCQTYLRSCVFFLSHSCSTPRVCTHIAYRKCATKILMNHSKEWNCLLLNVWTNYRWCNQF